MQAGDTRPTTTTASTLPATAPPGAGRRTSRRRVSRGGWSRSSRMVLRVGLALGAAFYLVFGIVPAVGTIVVSVTNYSSLAGSSTAFTGLQNFKQLVTTEWPGTIGSLKDTVIFVVGTTVLQAAAALVLAHRLRGANRGDGFLRALVFLPVVLGVTVVGLIWILIFDPSQGPATAALGLFHGQSAFFGSDAWAMPLVIFVQVWANLGFATLVFIGGLNAIDPSIFDAGSIDGITPWVRFRRISFPLLAPSLTVVVLLGVIGSFTTYNLIYVLTDGLYGTNTLGMLAFTSAFGGSADLGYGAAVSVALFVLTLAVALPVQAALRRRERRLVG